MKKLFAFVLIVAASMAVFGKGHDEVSDQMDSVAVDTMVLPMYQYFFKWLAPVALQIPTNRPEYVDNSYVLNTYLLSAEGLSSPFRDDEIAVEMVNVDSITVFVWKFPEPKEVPLCLYVAFVPGESGNFIAYTLEKSFDNKWYIGTSTSKSHRSFACIDRPASATSFVDEIAEAGLLDHRKSVEPISSFEPGN